MRCKELEEYIQEYCSERRKIKWEYLDKHYSMLFPAFVENLDILIKTGVVNKMIRNRIK